MRSLKFVLALGVALACFGSVGHAMEFPDVANTTDVDDVLSDYPAYLQFVLEVGRKVNPKLSARLEQRYTQLRKRDPQGAARFLRGLRFEMTQKLEMTGTNPSTVTTNNPSIRRWVAKFLPAWHREADEYWFRSFANPIARR